MVIDTSALLAILLQEPEAERFARAIALAARRLLSAATLLETGIVLQARYGDEGARDLDLLVYKLGLDIAPVTERQVGIARRAYRRYGKGQHHPAGLNFGDCFAYALAQDTGEPLLFKGEDFARTDVASAAW
jgi:ribonuclease VapC